MIIADSKKAGEGKKALLAEDDPIVLQVHKKFLEKMGFVVDTAINGEEAWKKYQSNYAIYSLIVLDGNMPVKSGFEVIKLIRTYERELKLKRKPLALITTDSHEQIKEYCDEENIDGYEMKPVKPEIFVKLILNCLFTES